MNYIDITDTDKIMFNQKIPVNVLVMTGTDYNSIEAYKIKEEGKEIYTGYGIDIFRQITQKNTNLDNKYTFNINYAEPTKSYDATVDEVSRGKYDIVIGNFTQTYERQLKVNYTIPLLLDGIAVMHMVKQSELFDNIRHTLFIMLKPLFILIIVGIIIGLVLSVFDSDRIKFTRISGPNKRTQFTLRSILTGVSTMFGEMGFMSENASKTIKGLLLSTFAMTIATMWILFMQAYLTTELIEKNKTSNTDIFLQKNGKPILGLKGYNEANTLKNMGGNVILYNNNKTMNDLINIYKNDPNKYAGVVFSYSDLFKHIQDDNSLGVTTGFNKVVTGFLVNPKRDIFLMDINNSIMAHKESGTLNKICNTHLIEDSELDVCFLVEHK